MVLTTTDSIEGFKIIDYLGIVTGVSMDYQKGKMTFSMSKWYSAIEDQVNSEKEKAFQQLRENAIKAGANAVVGINLDLEIATGSITVSVTGTAVKVAE